VTDLFFVFDDPIIPFWLQLFGWDRYAPNAIQIALVEDARTLSVDANTGEIYVSDNSATKPHVKAYKHLDALLANVTMHRVKPAMRPTSSKPRRPPP
jgi:hypothetical protein